MKIVKRKYKKTQIATVDGERVKWILLDKLPNNSYQVRYQLTGSAEVQTKYFNIMFTHESPKGNIQECELHQEVQPPDSEWLWKRQVARGVII